MGNFKEIKTTIIGFLLWVISGLYLGLPYFSEKELWEIDSVYVISLFVGGLALMLAPDRFLDILFGWMKKKTGIIAMLMCFSAVTIAGPGIKQLKKDGNYIVLTDTTTSVIEWRYPAKDLRYEIAADQYVRFYGRSDRRVGELNYNIDSLVDNSDAAFANLAAVETFLQDSTSGFSSAGSTASTTTGWAVYNDTQYTSGSPLAISSGQKRTLPNNAGSVIESQLPSDVDHFYVNSGDTTITGRNGDGLLWTIEFKVKPTSAASDIRVYTAVDIGGSVGEIYPRELSLTKGNGIEHYYLITNSGYTLDTWESNGGKVKIQAINGPIAVYDIRYVITRTHRAR